MHLSTINAEKIKSKILFLKNTKRNAHKEKDELIENSGHCWQIKIVSNSRKEES